jgi:hypothetical protein
METYTSRGARARRFIWRAAGAACLLACLGAATASAAVQPNRFGVVSSMNGFSLAHSPQSQWAPQLAAMRRQGVEMVRSDAPWAVIEPQAPTASGPTWQFAALDAWVSALAQNDLTWQPILDYNNSWANAATDNKDFAAFAQAVAARYGAGGSFWSQHRSLPYLPVQMFELWNEENSWQRPIRAQDYGPLYLAVHAAVHAVDPSASVDLGGLSDYGNFSPIRDSASWYLVMLFAYHPQLAQVIDGYALHPYGSSATDSAAWVVEFRHTLRHYDVPSQTPIDITEFGWPYSPLVEWWRRQQTSALGAAFSRSDCGIREVAPYDWINPFNDGMKDADFGLVDPSARDTTLRSAGAAWFGAFTQGSSESTSAVC